MGRDCKLCQIGPDCDVNVTVNPLLLCWRHLPRPRPAATAEQGGGGMEGAG